MTLSLVVGCGEPPRKEMDQAQGAIDAARAAGAAEYADAEFEAAINALSRAEEAVQQRDYRQALSQALDARTRAQAAARDAANRKAEMRSLAEREVRALDEAVTATASRLDALRATRVPAVLLAPAASALAAAEQAMQEARAHLAAQEFRRAAESLAGPSSDLSEVMLALEQAVAALPPQPPARRSR